ncbi:hypothetical protein Aph01nite_25470 [Acrocarpospora phusangensis]|uniref:Pectate lyase n=1 Tax=Acrocarpospora phusangensis TaxID=1070424 RepID=A0A919QDG3_9ACTN|nr:RICIN domain-containing protein [Acrocarpospora phusangensis]GIH24237.1 hypothetical protein Aph01nite_25470 [Acrocarpospora phusangensis]
MLRRSLSIALGVALAAAVAVVAQGTASAAPSPGTYTLVNANSGQCLDVPGGNTADGVQLVQYTCNNGTPQRFGLTAQGSGYRLTAAVSGRCLGVVDASTSAGKAVVQQSCTGATSQTWTLTQVGSTYRVINVNSAKCLNVIDSSTALSARVQQNSCDSVTSKHWTFNLVGSTQPSPSNPPASPSPTPSNPPTQPQTGLVGWATQGGGTTGGGTASATTVTSSSALSSAVSGTTARVVRISGTISCSGMITVGSNKTILGNSGATIAGCGLNVSNAANVIIRNINFRDWNDDAINVQYSTRVWIDHNSLSNGYDGAIDIKRASDYVTVSWNRIFNHDKSMLLGHDDGNGSEDRGHLRVTYHHNWFDGTGQRHPRVRFGNPVHVYNNYYGSVDSYGVASTEGAGVLVEGNYFENTDDPYHLGEGDSGPGTLVARNNHFVNSGSGQAGGSVASIPYSYSLDTASNVKSIVTGGAGAGRISV